MGEPEGKRGGSSRSRVRKNLLVGVALGLFIATGFSVFITIERVAMGTEPFERHSVTYSQLVAIYYIGFLVGGSLVGLLLPLRRWLLGQMFLGFVLLLPAYGAVVVQSAPRAEWFTRFNVVFTLAVSILGGGVIGIWSWFGDRRKKVDSERNGS